MFLPSFHTKKSTIVPFIISSAQSMHRNPHRMVVSSGLRQRRRIRWARFRYISKRRSWAAASLMIQNLMTFSQPWSQVLTMTISRFCQGLMSQLQFKMSSLSKRPQMIILIRSISDIMIAKLSYFRLLFIFISQFYSFHCWSICVKLKFWKRDSLGVVGAGRETLCWVFILFSTSLRILSLQQQPGFQWEYSAILISKRYQNKLLEAVGVKCIATAPLHAQQIQSNQYIIITTTTHHPILDPHHPTPSFLPSLTTHPQPRRDSEGKDG